MPACSASPASLPGTARPPLRGIDEQVARALAGLKGYVTSLARMPGRHPGHRRVRDRRLPPANSGLLVVGGCAGADWLGARHLLPGRNVQPLCVKLLVERPAVSGEPGQLTGVLDGVPVHALALLEAGAGADVLVPACGPAPLRPFTALPGQRAWIEGQPDGR